MHLKLNVKDRAFQIKAVDAEMVVHEVAFNLCCLFEFVSFVVDTKQKWLFPHVIGFEFIRTDLATIIGTKKSEKSRQVVERVRYAKRRQGEKLHGGVQTCCS